MTMLNEPEKNMASTPCSLESSGPETINGIIGFYIFVKARKAPNCWSEVVETLKSGDKVIIIGKTGEFCKVITGNGNIAYVFSDCIKEE